MSSESCVPGKTCSPVRNKPISGFYRVCQPLKYYGILLTLKTFISKLLVDSNTWLELCNHALKDWVDLVGVDGCCCWKDDPLLLKMLQLALVVHSKFFPKQILPWIEVCEESIRTLPH